MEEIDEFASALDKLTADFEKAYDRALLELISEIIVFASEYLTINEIATQDIISDNLTKVAEFRAKLRAIISKSELEETIQAYIKQFGAIAAQIDKYMLTISKDYAVTDELRLLLQNSVAIATEAMLNSGLDAAILNPVQNVLNRAALGDMKLSSLVKYLKQQLGNNAPQIRYAKQIASDALHIFVRQYQQRGADKLGLQHYLYAGTKIATTRPFCAMNIGKVFSKKEIEAFAAQDWEGKNPSTDSKTIFWLCGGYNCRHQLRPVSETTYNMLLSKQK